MPLLTNYNSECFYLYSMLGNGKDGFYMKFFGV